MPDAKIEINACTNYWRRSYDYATLMAYTTCVRAALGAQRIWPPKLRILRRAHGFVRDWFMTDDGWSEYDFLFHGWKAHNLTSDSDWKSPFEQEPNAMECSAGSYSGWHWRKEKRISVDEARKRMAVEERLQANNFPNRSRIHAHLTEPEIAECYPFCDQHI